MGDWLRAGKPSGYVTSHLCRLSLLPSVGWQNECQLSCWVIINGNFGCSFIAAYRRANGSSLSTWCKGLQPSSSYKGAVLHSSCELGALTQWLLSHEVSSINIFLVLLLFLLILLLLKSGISKLLVIGTPVISRLLYTLWLCDVMLASHLQVRGCGFNSTLSGNDSRQVVHTCAVKKLLTLSLNGQQVSKSYFWDSQRNLEELCKNWPVERKSQIILLI